MKEKTLKKAFAPFYTESDDDGHMGLGLAICKILCRKHGGNITLRNKAKGGTLVSCFVVIDRA